MTVPPEAVTAAAVVLRDRLACFGIRIPADDRRAIAAAVLEAAAPLITSEREANLRAALARFEGTLDLAQSKAVELAVAGERRRIVALAGQCAAKIEIVPADHALSGAETLRWFADLLRGDEPPPGLVIDPDAMLARPELRAFEAHLDEAVSGGTIGWMLREDPP